MISWQSRQLLPLAHKTLSVLVVDAIVADGPEAPVREAYKATRAIPIDAVAINYDPVERGYAAKIGRAHV